MWFFETLSHNAVKGRKSNFTSKKKLDILSKQAIAHEENELEDIRARYRDKADLNRQVEILNDQLDMKNNIVSSLQNELKSLSDKVKKNNELISEDQQQELNAAFRKFFNSDIYMCFLNKSAL